MLADLSVKWLLFIFMRVIPKKQVFLLRFNRSCVCVYVFVCIFKSNVMFGAVSYFATATLSNHAAAGYSICIRSKGDFLGIVHCLPKLVFD